MAQRPYREDGTSGPMSDYEILLGVGISACVGSLLKEPECRPVNKNAKSAHGEIAIQENSMEAKPALKLVGTSIDKAFWHCER